MVELYTSEGCSSCPPAERWLASFAEQGSAISLVFHVDYWDYLGWRDRYASPRFTARQRARVGQAGARVTYTPQVMIGPQIQVDWRSAPRLQAALQEAAAAAKTRLELALVPGPGALQIELGARPIGAGGLEIGDAQLWIALTEDGLASQVDAGENRGQELRHQRVVRLWLGPYSLNPQRARWQGQIDWQADWRGPQLRVAALIEDQRNGRTLAAVDLALGPCLAAQTPE